MEIIATLESVLERDPMHMGALPYYIHAVEASPHPEKGLAAATRLRTLLPPMWPTWHRRNQSITTRQCM